MNFRSITPFVFVTFLFQNVASAQIPSFTPENSFRVADERIKCLSETPHILFNDLSVTAHTSALTAGLAQSKKRYQKH